VSVYPRAGGLQGPRIYAHCIDGQADAANQRITDALSTTEAKPGSGDEGDGDIEPAA
jgi:hypothetical protein